MEIVKIPSAVKKMPTDSVLFDSDWFILRTISKAINYLYGLKMY